MLFIFCSFMFRSIPQRLCASVLCSRFYTVNRPKKQKIEDKKKKCETRNHTQRENE